MTPSPSTPAHLIALADTIDVALDAFLHAFEGGQTQGNAKAVLERILWDDKGTFAPALRQAAEAASLKARIEELEKAMRNTEGLAPEGWKLVPLIPNQAMIEVGCDNNPTSWNEGTNDGFAADVANDVYVSMVNAAPRHDDRWLKKRRDS